MDSDNTRSFCCCFTGHRPEKMLQENLSLHDTETYIKNLLRPVVSKAISDGYKIFITGMARGFDIWAADIILEERLKNPDLHLICALPFAGFESRRSASEQEHCKSILRSCDYIKAVCSCYAPNCFQIRNVYMVDRSSLIIAAYNGSPGGTKNTLEYARRTGVGTVNILM